MSVEYILNVEPRLDGRVDKEYFCLDCSGKDASYPLCFQKSGIQHVRGVLSSRSSVIADLDDDGDLDIVVAEFNDRPQLLVSNLSEKRNLHFLKVRLEGTMSNRDGLGATVRVSAGGKTYTQFHDGKSGYLSQSSLPLYFGLSKGTQVDLVEVIWPSGARQKIGSNVPINSEIRVKEPRLSHQGPLRFQKEAASMAKPETADGSVLAVTAAAQP